MTSKRKNPSREDVEKIAKTIVIKVKNEGCDPYEEIHNTGLSDPLKELMLKKFNIHSFLDDFHNHDGDPHTRDVGSSPLDVKKLFEGAPGETQIIDEPGRKGTVTIKELSGPGMRGVMKVKKVVARPETSQVLDMQSMRDIDVAAPSDEKLASAPPATEPNETHPLSMYDDYSLTRLRAVHKLAEEQMMYSAHQYKGFIEKVAEELPGFPIVQKELERVHGDAAVVDHIFKAAGLELSNEKVAYQYVLSESKQADEIVEQAEGLLKEVSEKQKVAELLLTVIKKREKN